MERAATVRQLGPGDEAMLVELVDAIAPPEAGWAAEGPMGFLADPTSFVFAAHVDGQPAGFAWGLQLRYPTGRRVTYLHQLDVAPPFRRRGLATALVTAAMGWSLDHGSSRFWLSTGGHNEDAQALYERLGGDRKPLGDVNYWWSLDPGP